MHTYTHSSGWRIHFNSDLSGAIYVTGADGTERRDVPTELARDFAAYIAKRYSAEAP